MKLSELVEAKAREAATECGAGLFCTTDEFAFRVGLAKYAIIATLNECGFREALETLTAINETANDEEGEPTVQVCIACATEHYLQLNQYTQDADCTCPCHTAEAKLKELEEMSK